MADKRERPRIDARVSQAIESLQDSSEVAKLRTELASAQAELAELRLLRDRIIWCEQQSAEGVRVVWGEYRITGQRFCSVMAGRYTQFEESTFPEAFDKVRERIDRYNNPRAHLLG